MTNDIWTSEQPYAELGPLHGKRKAVDRDDVIIVTSRFGSGMPMLRLVFARMWLCTACTTYYQPLHDRRWLPATKLDPKHNQVDYMLVDTWRQYGDIEGPKPPFQEEWARRNLFMDESSHDPVLKRYLEALIDAAPAQPILLSSHLDFRLPWVRHHFPRAVIVHLYRHPRDQWMSALKDPAKLSRRSTIAEFAAHDQGNLLTWMADLKGRFPFLAELTHPYQLSYALWRLSYLYGRQHAHLSVRYEDLQKGPLTTLPELLVKLRCSSFRCDEIPGSVCTPHPGRWRQVDNDGWFRDQETHCESVLAEFFSIATKQRIAAAA
jgi:hypothetical protein